jgi:hypothetical protein
MTNGHRLAVTFGLLLSLFASDLRADAEVFPPIDAELLTGDALALPAALPTERGVVLVAFERAQQKQIETWLPKLRPMADGDAGLSVHVVNCMPADTGGFTRVMAETAMKTFLPKEKKQITALTYVELEGMRQKLGLPDLGDISVFVIDRSGKVHAHVRGAMTTEKLARLRAPLTPGS